MKVFRPTFTDKRTGKTKRCSHYYLTFVDNRQIRRRLPAYSNKGASDTLSVKVNELLASGGVLSQDLQRWIESLPDKQRSKLIEFGLIDNQRLSANIGKALDAHLQDYCAGLAADNRKASYIRQVESGIRRILSDCRFTVWSDIDGNAVKTFLAKGRGPGGYGERSYNGYLRGFKGFCAWLIREGRVAGANPMDGHTLIRQTTFRKKRRALTMDEQRRLLTATEAAPKRFNMSGYERSLVYRVALQTGARMGEITAMRKLSFDFESTPCTVHVEASDCKGKRSDDLILMDDTATMIREFLRDKLPLDRAFAMPHKANYAKMLRCDLAEAGIEYRDEAGRDVDAHALRHSFITGLALAGVHPAVAQKLARHASIELTMRYYTHVLHESEVAAIVALKSLSCACPDGALLRNLAETGGEKRFVYGSKTA